MGLKSKIGVFVLACAVIGITLFVLVQKEPYSTEAVVDSVWEKYEVQSTQIGEYEDPNDGKPVIFIDVYDKDDIPKVEKYLEKNLSKDDLDYYEIDVFPYNSAGSS